MIPVWEAGKTYVPGALVKPASATPAVVSAIPNGDFESGFTGWTAPSGWSVVSDKNYTGTKSVKFLGTGTPSGLNSTFRGAVVPGQTITAQIMVSLDQIASSHSGGRILLLWFDQAGALISFDAAENIDKAKKGVWQLSKVTASAPAGAVSASVSISANSDDGAFSRFDAVSWDYIFSGNAGGLVFKAVQDGPGKSGVSEPVWPTVNGLTVIDNEVVWEAVLASRLVWQASPLLKSGATEPVWPLQLGGMVRDGSINWETITPRITDPNCPQSKIVVLAASKVYAADNDIIRYSATVNPLDWTTKDDAGYLPYGLQTYGSNPVAAMGLYRSNLVAFNAEGFQMWQVDEDPSATALLDALPVGSTHHAALSPVSNDLFFLSSQGVRTIGIAASSTNLQAGDVGMPIDELIKEALGSTPIEPIGTFVPAMGQYWLAISGLADADPSLSGDIPDGIVGTIVDMHYVVTGGTAPIVLDIMSGDLPSGVSMDATGHATGPFSVGGEVASWVVRATDADGRTVILYDNCQVASGLAAQLSNWKYLVTTLSDNTDRSAVGFDDSAWTLGKAPFGNLLQNPGVGINAKSYNDAFSASIGTQVPLDQRVWLRRIMNLASVPTGGFTMIGYFDNAYKFYVNGVLASDGTTITNAGVTVTIGASYFHDGDNTIALELDDDATHTSVDASYFDFLMVPAS